MSDEPSESDQPRSILGELRGTTDPTEIKAAADARISNRHYSAIGQVAASWSYFEAVVGTWIAHFLRVDVAASICVTAQMLGPRSRLDAFIALARLRGAKAKWNDDLEALAKDATSLGERRNRVLHDMWDLSNPEEPKRREATAKKKLRLLDVHEPTSKLLEFVSEFYAFSSRFDDIASAIFSEIVFSSRGKRSQDTRPANHTGHPQDKISPKPETRPNHLRRDLDLISWFRRRPVGVGLSVVWWYVKRIVPKQNAWISFRFCLDYLPVLLGFPSGRIWKTFRANPVLIGARQQ